MVWKGFPYVSPIFRTRYPLANPEHEGADGLGHAAFDHCADRPSGEGVEELGQVGVQYSVREVMVFGFCESVGKGPVYLGGATFSSAANDVFGDPGLEPRAGSLVLAGAPQSVPDAKNRDNPCVCGGAVVSVFGEH